jgi:hypothetical protein
MLLINRFPSQLWLFILQKFYQTVVEFVDEHDLKNWVSLKASLTKRLSIISLTFRHKLASLIVLFVGYTSIPRS